jgi:GNAT superfamily N-acetyltransferase
MTDSMFSTLARARHYPVEEVRSVRRLAEYLEPERLFAAYALAQLEPDAFPHARWFICPHDLGVSLVCHSRAGLGDATFTLGPAEGIAAILSIQPGQPLTFATAKPQHLGALEEAYTLTGARKMRRLHVSRQTFQAAAFAATHDVSLLRLRGHQVRTLNRLYGSEGGPTSYQPHHVDEGCYYGVVERGRLVAVAGTHAISPSHGVAVVGNVFTHPQHRGRGYATIATSATTRDLLRSCRPSAPTSRWATWTPGTSWRRPRGGAWAA